jgi:restriction system protein
MSEKIFKVRTPWFPRYSRTRELIKAIQGVPSSKVAKLIKSIWEHVGTPQDPVDWTDPDIWISERLAGEDAELARRIWEMSNRTVNPRHISGPLMFINNYKLLEKDQNDVYKLTEWGEGFINNAAHVIREIDDAEGLLQLLTILSPKTKAKRADLLPEWEQFLSEYSKFGKPSTIKDTLTRRLRNLHERGLIERDGNTYSITDEGLEYLSTISPTELNLKREALNSVKNYNKSQLEELKDRLINMHPYQFEHLIKQLLEAMGYEDVEVTKQVGDKGVDVVATVQFGITTIREVVQVKKHQASIGRRVLDELRGVLPYHNAIRGTIMTTGSISKGCKEFALFPGAAPITLIDGNKLIELLIEHKIGVRVRPIDMIEVDQELFENTGEQEEDSLLEE